MNPSDGSLLIASHTGLFRAGRHERSARRVGDSNQDTMGFNVVGPDRFLGSGHPGSGANLPPLLGLIESRDAGRSWQQVSLLGEADFHVLESSGNRVYGYDSSGGRLMVSSDGGHRWVVRSPPEPLVSLALDPKNPDRTLASGSAGLYASNDAGRRWREVTGEAGLLSWPVAGQPYIVNADGGVAKLGDGRWRRVGEIGGKPAAFEAGARDQLQAALHDGTVKASSDGGRSWLVRSRH